MARKEPVPILLSPQVVLPGWSYLLELSTPAEKELFYKFMEPSANRDVNPKYVGVLPAKSSRMAPKAGDIGAYSKVVSCTRNLAEQDVVVIRVAGQKRMIIEEIVSTSGYCVAHVRILEDPEESVEEVINALDRHGLSYAAGPVQFAITNFGLKHIEKTIESIITRSRFSTNDKIELLESLKFSERLIKMLKMIERDETKLGDISKNFGGLGMLFNSGYKPFGINMKMGQRIPTVTSHISRLPVISRYHIMKDGVNEPVGSKLATKIQEAKMPPEIRKVALEEMSRLTSIPAHGSEHALLQNYLETLVALPWGVSSQDHIDVNKAKEELERDHYAMDKVKRRVLEYLAVKQLKKSQMRGPILCFVGPPGVGKTSIARSIASILGRKFHRIGLGGVCDASDIRGSRRTYIGAMPGRIIKGLQFCGTNNPLLLLDEIDKMSSGNLHGNPLAVLLEVLDPEQNAQFTDHYLGLPFDLSKVVFIATANSMDTIPAALRDRIEVIRVNGYTEEEKFHIARDFIIPKSLVEHGLSEEQVVIPDETLKFVIASYSREAGVRTLERKIGALMRDAALKVAADHANNETPVPLLIDEETARAVLGGGYYHKGSDSHWTEGCVPGVVVGLSYTQLGGEILPIEASKLVPGKGKLILTGKLGEVLSESAKIAFDWFKNALTKYQIYEDLGAVDVHIHLPAGAVSKEGPSAGIALATALVSLFSGIPPVPKIALTGEITLQGHVLPVGGLKEKLAAARKAGVTKVILPKKCESSLDDIPRHLLDQLELIMVEHMSEVVYCAFDGAIAENSALVSKL